MSELSKDELARQQAEKRRRARVSSATASTMASLGVALANADQQGSPDPISASGGTGGVIAAEPFPDHPVSSLPGVENAVPPSGGSAHLAVEPNQSITGVALPVPRSASSGPAARPKTLRQGMTYLSLDFEQLQDIVYALQRKHRIKNPLGAKLGPSHVAGALVHYLLPLWETDERKIVEIVEGFLSEWGSAEP
jgi:hypothetical protein